MTTIAPARPVVRSDFRAASAVAERGPWLAGLVALAVVAFPAVQLMIESIVLVFDGSRPRLSLALALSAMSLVLFAMPVLVAKAVRRNSKAALLMALLAMLTILIGSACWTFS